jgi:tetratricopeptide (TPR) repeat protein
MSSTSTPTIGPLDPGDATPLPLQPGDLVGGRYEILRLLGSGGSAFVYAVRDRKIGDEIALKLLRKAARSEIDVKRTRREAEFARGSASPRLVRTFDLAEADGHVFLTMELVSGGSLRDLLRRGPLPVDEAVRLAGEILEALAALHALDIVHRDLKPANLLLTADGHVKLSDFGIARRWTDEDARLTRTGLPMGTVDYLSPEQAAAEPADPRADLYSFGVVLFEMLTGRVPFEAPSAVGSIVMRLHRRAADVRKLRPEVPRWLTAIVARLLERKREDRYASAEAVLEDMRRKRRRISWRPIAAAMVVLLVGGALGTAALRVTRHPELHFVNDGDWGVRAVDGHGDTVWTRNDTDASRTASVRRGSEASVVAVLTRSPRILQSEPSRMLSFLDERTGSVLRNRRIPSPASTWFSEHPDFFGAAPVTVTDLNGDGYEEVVVTYVHHYWPSFTVVYDLHRDRFHHVFIASGHHQVKAVEDLDGDGTQELILAGTANRQGWYIGVAAIRVQLDAPHDATVASTPDRDNLLRSRSLLWYALGPPGYLQPSAVTVDRERRLIHFDYGSGQPFALTFEGFAPIAAELPMQVRQARRERAYAHLRTAVRLIDIGLADDAVAEAEAARVEAASAGDAVLTEWSARVRGVALVRAGHFAEADAFFTALAVNSPAASDISWDAANAYHLRGELPRALVWYRRSLGRAGRPGVGRLKYEAIQGLVLALGEMNRWTEAREEIDRFAAGYSWEAEHWTLFRRYVTWRTGGIPSAPYDPYNGTDVYRYWPLEFALARHHDLTNLLRVIDEDRRHASETSALLLVTKAETLRQLGRIDEALDVARDAMNRVRAECHRSTLARAHYDLAAERLARLAEAKGFTAEARQVRAEAAALRWHPNGIAR